MGIGKNTLKRAFDEVSRREHLTRKELARLLGTSEVSAGRAVDALVGAGLLSVSKGNADGRVSDIISASDSRLCLLIDLCEKGVSFALSSPEREVREVYSLPFLHMRDPNSNLIIALSDIVKHIKSLEKSPDVIAVAFPSTLGSPSPACFADELKARGLYPDVLVSGAEAVSTHFGNSFAFLSVESIIWGCSSADPSRMLNWGSIKVGARHGESLSDALSYDTNEEHLRIYLRRAITSINTVLAPEKLFVSSSFLPKTVMNITDEFPNTADASSSNAVINGLLSLAKDKLFEKFISIS